LADGINNDNDEDEENLSQYLFRVNHQSSNQLIAKLMSWMTGAAVEVAATDAMEVAAAGFSEVKVPYGSGLSRNPPRLHIITK